MRRPPHAARFEALGFELRRFAESDTRSYNPEGNRFKYYAAKDGALCVKFLDASHALEWVEARENAAIYKRNNL